MPYAREVMANLAVIRPRWGDYRRMLRAGAEDHLAVAVCHPHVADDPVVHVWLSRSSAA
jgi:hypothetical protein